MKKQNVAIRNFACLSNLFVLVVLNHFKALKILNWSRVNALTLTALWTININWSRGILFKILQHFLKQNEAVITIIHDFVFWMQEFWSSFTTSWKTLWSMLSWRPCASRTWGKLAMRCSSVFWVNRAWYDTILLSQLHLWPLTPYYRKLSSPHH